MLIKYQLLAEREFVMDMLVDIQPSVFVGRVLLVLRCSVSLIPIVSGVGSVPDHSHDGSYFAAPARDYGY